MVFSLDPGAQHRPLGVVFGADVDARLALGWVGVERRDGAAVAAILPPNELASPVSRFTRGQLMRSGALAGGLVLVRETLAESELPLLAEAAASAAKRPIEQILILAAPDRTRMARSGFVTSDERVRRLVGEAQTARAADLARLLAGRTKPALASARGIVDGQRVSLLGIAGGRPLPHRSDGLVALVLTDAALAPPALDALLSTLAERSFGQVAGVRTPGPDDAILALATGAAGSAPLDVGAVGYRTLLVGAVAVAQTLVRQLLEATSDDALVVQITVSGATTDEEAARTAEALAADDATHAAMAVAADAPDQFSRRLAQVVARAAVDSSKLHANVTRKTGRAALRVDLSLGNASATRWTAFASGAPGGSDHPA